MGPTPPPVLSDWQPRQHAIRNPLGERIQGYWYRAQSSGVPHVAAMPFIEQPADLAPIVDLLSLSPKAESPQTERFLWFRLLNLLPQPGLNQYPKRDPMGRAMSTCGPKQGVRHLHCGLHESSVPYLWVAFGPGRPALTRPPISLCQTSREYRQRCQCRPARWPPSAPRSGSTS